MDSSSEGCPPSSTPQPPPPLRLLMRRPSFDQLWTSKSKLPREEVMWEVRAWCNLWRIVGPLATANHKFKSPIKLICSKKLRLPIKGSGSLRQWRALLDFNKRKRKARFEESIFGFWIKIYHSLCCYNLKYEIVRATQDFNYHHCWTDFDANNTAVLDHADSKCNLTSIIERRKEDEHSGYSKTPI